MRWFVNLSSLDDEIATIWGELGKRYEGVLKQMLAHDAVPMAEAKSMQTNVFRTARASFDSYASYEQYPVVLWSAYVAHSHSPPTNLRQKFMLRAFVDEIRSGEERGVIIAICYPKSMSANPTRELRKKWNLGCILLHDQVLAAGARIDNITDGALKHVDLLELRSDSAVIEQYEAWLMI